jgi:DNA helicase HerA-like ATPase
MPTDNSIRLPKSSQHLAIVGRNGSGKTQAGLWHLSNMPFDRRPYVAIDFKGDEHINAIEGARHISMGDPIPRAAGIYVIHPTPQDAKNGTLDEWLWKIYERENTGLWIDEGYMLGDSSAFETLLTQGRSKHIPIMTLTQRPVWVSRFVFSESMYYQIFALNDRRDKKTVESFVPVSMDSRLPEFHSWYYDVGRDRLTGLKPVPSETEILAAIDLKLQAIKPGKRVNAL